MSKEADGAPFSGSARTEDEAALYEALNGRVAKIAGAAVFTHLVDVVVDSRVLCDQVKQIALMEMKAAVAETGDDGDAKKVAAGRLKEIREMMDSFKANIDALKAACGEIKELKDIKNKGKSQTICIAATVALGEIRALAIRLNTSGASYEMKAAMAAYIDRVGVVTDRYAKAASELGYFSVVEELAKAVRDALNTPPAIAGTQTDRQSYLTDAKRCLNLASVGAGAAAGAGRDSNSSADRSSPGA